MLNPQTQGLLEPGQRQSLGQDSLDGCYTILFAPSDLLLGGPRPGRSRARSDPSKGQGSGPLPETLGLDRGIEGETAVYSPQIDLALRRSEGATAASLYGPLLLWSPARSSWMSTTVPSKPFAPIPLGPLCSEVLVSRRRQSREGVQGKAADWPNPCTCAPMGRIVGVLPSKSARTAASQVGHAWIPSTWEGGGSRVSRSRLSSATL